MGILHRIQKCDNNKNHSKPIKEILQETQGAITMSSSQSNASKASAVGTSIGSNAPINSAGSAAFCDSSREIHDRTPEMELFSHGRKPRSNFRRPSSLGLSATPVASKTESKSNYQAKPATRTHIVAPLKDHLKPEGAFEKTSESKGNYRDLSPSRPVIHKLKDHLKPEGDFAKSSEMKQVYNDLHPQRPVIHRLRDHSAEVQPEGRMENETEANSYKKMSKGGEIVEPAWVSNFEKVTIN